MAKGRKLKATLQSQQSRLQKKAKSEQAAKDAELRSRQKSQPKKKGKERAPLASPTIPFLSTDNILLIGEGNFSFARALIQDPPPQLAFLPAANITATAYDSEEECYQKYPDAEAIVTLLRAKGVDVRFGVDATKLDKIPAFKTKRWDRIVWNFPHAGKGIADMERNILSNQLLILSFLRCAAGLLVSGPVPASIAFVKPKKNRADDGDNDDDGPNSSHEEALNSSSSQSPNFARGTILITLRNVSPYTLWDVPRLAKKPPAPASESAPANKSYTLVRSFVFHRHLWKGYEHRMTKGERMAKVAEGEERTWEFCLKPVDHSKAL